MMFDKDAVFKLHKIAIELFDKYPEISIRIREIAGELDNTMDNEREQSRFQYNLDFGNESR